LGHAEEHDHQFSYKREFQVLSFKQKKKADIHYMFLIKLHTNRFADNRRLRY